MFRLRFRYRSILAQHDRDRVTYGSNFMCSDARRTLYAILVAEAAQGLKPSS
jgi:hypothetical protein